MTEIQRKREKCGDQKEREHEHTLRKIDGLCDLCSMVINYRAVVHAGLKQAVAFELGR